MEKSFVLYTACFFAHYVSFLDLLTRQPDKVYGAILALPNFASYNFIVLEIYDDIFVS